MINQEVLTINKTEKDVLSEIGIELVKVEEGWEVRELIHDGEKVRVDNNQGKLLQDMLEVIDTDQDLFAEAREISKAFSAVPFLDKKIRVYKEGSSINYRVSSTYPWNAGPESRAIPKKRDLG